MSSLKQGVPKGATLNRASPRIRRILLLDKAVRVELPAKATKGTPAKAIVWQEFLNARFRIQVESAAPILDKLNDVTFAVGFLVGNKFVELRGKCVLWGRTCARTFGTTRGR